MAAVETALTLRPLREDEFPAWYSTGRDEYAESMATQAGVPPDAARSRAEKQLAEILPEGLATPGHAIFVVERDGERVGRLWLSERELDGRRVLYVYDIEIDAPFRGQGLGRATMLLAEDEARARGIARLELNVWGANAPARHLYQSLGYIERAISMGKDL
jgi:ribosomal protein S18 acetylase RimI-like enzyme